MSFETQSPRPHAFPRSFPWRRLAQVTASDADLRAAYEKAKSRLEVPEKRHARHVLITGKDDAAALA